jgi:hypothetical protein
MKKQIQKQLKFACKLLKEISNEHEAGNFSRFGQLAYAVQSDEVKRLTYLLKNTIDFIK